MVTHKQGEALFKNMYTVTSTKQINIICPKKNMFILKNKRLQKIYILIKRSYRINIDLAFESLSK